MFKTKALKIALVGPGLIGKQHIRCLISNERCELAAIVAPNSEENIKISVMHQVPFYSDLMDCLAKCKPDGVIVASPNAFHFEQALACIRMGVPVLIEKPIVDKIEDGKELVDLVNKYNSRVLIGHHRTHSPLMKTARDLIKSGRLGTLVSIIGSAQFYKPDNYFSAGAWRTKIGGGPILINLIHEIGNLRSLIGEIDSVYAFTSSKIRNYEVEDTASINFRFKNGVLGTFMLSDTAASASSWEQTSKENMQYPSYSDADCYNISGTRGSLFFPSMKLKYYPDNSERSWWLPFSEEEITVPYLDPLVCQLDHFIDVVRGEASPLVTAEDGYNNLLVTEAVKKSALTNSVISI